MLCLICKTEEKTVLLLDSTAMVQCSSSILSCIAQLLVIPQIFLRSAVQLLIVISGEMSRYSLVIQKLNFISNPEVYCKLFWIILSNVVFDLNSKLRRRVIPPFDLIQLQWFNVKISISILSCLAQFLFILQIFLWSAVQLIVISSEMSRYFLVTKNLILLLLQKLTVNYSG